MPLKENLSPKSKKAYLPPVSFHPLEGGGYLAVCEALQGCHAEGETVAEALDNLADVAKNLVELRQLDGVKISKELSA